MKPNILLILFLQTFSFSYGQSESDFEKLTATPKNIKDFEIDYKINLPRTVSTEWEKDYELNNIFLTPAVRKSQMYWSYTTNGVHTMVCPNSARPHAQLDTLIMINDESQVNGTWRMITHRSIRFIDSFSVATQKFYRNNTILVDNSKSDAFVFFREGRYKIYAKEDGDKKFKNKSSAKYSIENKRFLMLYKLVKGGGSVSQIGIDENGYLIMNYPSVIENTKQKEYISYYSVIEQLIFEKVK